jgi:hypothetical protein
MDFLRFMNAPDSDMAGYPVGRMSGHSKCRIQDIRCRPDTGYLARYNTIKVGGLIKNVNIAVLS